MVTGAGGMVGRAVCERSAASGDFVLAYDHNSLDISNLDLVMRTLEQQGPDDVINCAARTDVDRCKLNPQKSFAEKAERPE
ncbi:MAG: sugar nucleotide-binding protein, partial [Acidobacteriota bacterium]|nr:sugar nucleotide-binding protein [Acidobacteriota bacterium]